MRLKELELEQIYRGFTGESGLIGQTPWYHPIKAENNQSDGTVGELK
jgi:hypothetical protein